MPLMWTPFSETSDARDGRVQFTNYKTKKMPSDVNVPVFIPRIFPQSYRAMFDRMTPVNGALLEHPWDMAWFNPCADDPLSHAEIQSHGVPWVKPDKAASLRKLTGWSAGIITSNILKTVKSAIGSGPPYDA